MANDADRCASRSAFDRLCRRLAVSKSGRCDPNNGGIESTAGAHNAGPADRLLTEGRAIVYFGESEVLVVRTRRGLFAVENRCPHMGRRLSDAFVSGRSVICAGHHRRYDLASGQPAGRIMSRAPRLRTFGVDLVDGTLWLSPTRSV